MKPDSGTYAVRLTPPGRGGIGAVCLWGERAWEIATEIFHRPQNKPLRQKPERIYYGHIHDGERVLDEGILHWRGSDQESPQNAVEIHCHGGIAMVGALLELARRQGASSASEEDYLGAARESRAFDQVQQEARSALLRAPTPRAALLLLDQSNGALSREIQSIREDLASFPFPAPPVRRRLAKLLDTFRWGRSLTDPPRVVLLGLTNAGKSSLFNALIGRQRVLVDKEPGTTRDVIEETLALNGFPFRLVDMAGIREPEHPIERQGVELALEEAARADLALLVLDASDPHPQKEAELYRKLQIPVLVVHNKIDLRPPGPRRVPGVRSDQQAGFASRSAEISCLEGIGLGELEEKIQSALGLPHEVGPNTPILFTDRQVRGVKKTVDILLACLRRPRVPASRESRELLEQATQVLDRILDPT